MSNYVHPLSDYERQRIEYFLRLKYSFRMIGRRLGRDHTVISRELKRNQGKEEKYFALKAQRKAELRSHRTNRRKLEVNEPLRDYVERKLLKAWSPEQISGRLKLHSPPTLKGFTISHESIYDYIYEGRDSRYLYHYLRRAKRRRQKRNSRKKQKKMPITDRISLHERPEIIEMRKRYGDWESDLAVFSKQKNALSVQCERKTHFLRMKRVADKTAEENERVLVENLEPLPNELRQSLTFDNGGENASHAKLRESLNLKTYFCDPYSAWQKGGVENIIGLVRQYLPKKTNLSTFTDEDIENIQETLNNRPRKTLNYLTPNEVINLYLAQEVVR